VRNKRPGFSQALFCIGLALSTVCALPPLLQEARVDGELAKARALDARAARLEARATAATPNWPKGSDSEQKAPALVERTSGQATMAEAEAARDEASRVRRNAERTRVRAAEHAADSGMHLVLWLTLAFGLLLMFTGGMRLSYQANSGGRLAFLLVVAAALLAGGVGLAQPRTVPATDTALWGKAAKLESRADPLAAQWAAPAPRSGLRGLGVSPFSPQRAGAFFRFIGIQYGDRIDVVSRKFGAPTESGKKHGQMRWQYDGFSIGWDEHTGQVRSIEATKSAADRLLTQTGDGKLNLLGSPPAAIQVRYGTAKRFGSLHGYNFSAGLATGTVIFVVPEYRGECSAIWVVWR
jgi:hypothetical protein